MCSCVVNVRYLKQSQFACSNTCANVTNDIEKWLKHSFRQLSSNWNGMECTYAFGPAQHASDASVGHFSRSVELTTLRLR